MGTTTSESPFTTPKAVAAHLGVSVQTVYDLINRGELPALRVGRKLFKIRPAEVERYLAKGKQGR
jgi:putative molybdopterin biosynthesis protein